MKWLRWLGSVLLAALGIAALLFGGRRTTDDQAAAGRLKRQAEDAADDANELNREADAREREASDIRAQAEKELEHDNPDESPADIVERWNRRGVRKPPR